MAKRKKIVYLIAGARPNFMKIAPLYNAFRKSAVFNPAIVHTGQHYDKNMSQQFFKDLEMPRPHIYLDVGSGSHGVQTARVMERLEKVCLKNRPDLIVVVGDVNSTMAAAIVAAKLLIPLAHVEAGLRSFDRKMPEEVNRVVTDALSDYLFTTSKDANENLKKEGIAKDKIFFVGNVMIDTLCAFKEKAKDSSILNKLKLSKKEYAVLTLHRPSNVDDKKELKEIVKILEDISKKITIVFPVHPRTKKKIEKSVNKGAFKKIKCIEPAGYIDFLRLLSESRFALTDSGGIQEETTILGIPCLTLRQNTERPVTITEGTNVLTGVDEEKIKNELKRILNGSIKRPRRPKLWDGNTAGRIIRVLEGDFKGVNV